MFALVLMTTNGQGLAHTSGGRDKTQALIIYKGIPKLKRELASTFTQSDLPVKLALKRDNPIRLLFALEKNLYLNDERKFRIALLRFNHLIKTLKADLNSFKEFTVEQKIWAAYRIINFEGYGYQESDYASMIDDLYKWNLDCDTSAYIILALAHEFGWKVGVVAMGGHVRQPDGSRPEYYHMALFYQGQYLEYGRKSTKQQYAREFNIPPETVGIMLKPKYGDSLKAHFYGIYGYECNIRHMWEHAIWALEESVRLDPTLGWIYPNLGVAYSQTGKTDQAKMTFRKAIRLNKNIATNYYRIAVQYLNEGRPDLAWANLRVARRLNPSDQRTIKLISRVENQ